MLHPSLVEKYESRLKEIGDAGIQVSKLTHSKNWYGAIAYAETSIQEFLRFGPLHHEVFGPFTCLVSYRNSEDLLEIWPKIKGQLTTTIISNSLEENIIYPAAALNSGRIIHNHVPTGVVVNPSMHHGGPFPSSSDARFTSVGEASVLRFLRPITIQKT
jgi:NADP-dependent aldehyde dehydrogenase